MVLFPQEEVLASVLYRCTRQLADLLLVELGDQPLVSEYLDRAFSLGFVVE